MPYDMSHAAYCCQRTRGTQLYSIVRSDDRAVALWAVADYLTQDAC